MRFPPGVDPDNAGVGYLSALEGFTIEAITHGVRRFLRGEVEGVNPRYCPHPPELARIIREGTRPEPTFTGKLYGYSAPHSKLLERKCTKEHARGLVNSGVHPRGSIWCPGPIDAQPEIGDLYGPDEKWKPARPLKDAA